MKTCTIVSHEQIKYFDGSLLTEQANSINEMWTMTSIITKNSKSQIIEVKRLNQELPVK